MNTPAEDKALQFIHDVLSPTESGSGSLEVIPELTSYQEASNTTGIYPTLATESTLSAFFGLALCDGRWLPSNNLLFQLANAFLFLSCLAPPGLHGLLFLRVCLMIGSLFLSLWGWIILCAFDTFVWNAIFTGLNFVHAVILLYMLRPIRFKRDLESVYQELFKPLRVSRQHFKKLLSCSKEVQPLKAREAYCLEKVTWADRLTLVVAGRLVVTQGGHTLHMIEKHQFLDSPEWFGVSSDDFYQTTIIALEESRVLVWNRDKLRLSISNDSFLQAVFDNVLGKDVVKKLLLVAEANCNGSTLNDTSDSHSSSETAKLLQGSGKTNMQVTVARPLDSNAWNLSNIAEDPRDTETTV